uniref:ZT_dimer domain-containing protein n=1 Tax=Haemonchus placei TaxID=6290 RepID=A0A0N4WBW2_HAEPC
LRKPKKVVSEYYKKQNELLENFKNDSEQILVRCFLFVIFPSQTTFLRSGREVSMFFACFSAIASYLSGSLSILSSLVDSCVDITSGLVISISTRMIKKRDPYLYPRGRTRLEPLSLIIISVVMGVASVQLIVGACGRIAAAYQFHVHGIGAEPLLDVSLTSALIMVGTVVVKFTLFCICQKYKSDPSITVLAMDHRNDCLSNTVALACAWLGNKFWYYLDPIGAILVSIYILYTWVTTGWDHLSKLSGKSAKPEFINRIIKVCIDHDPRISHLDTVYVYHFGTKFLVEVHIVLDESMPLKVAHDISESFNVVSWRLPYPSTENSNLTPCSGRSHAASMTRCPGSSFRTSLFSTLTSA